MIYATLPAMAVDEAIIDDFAAAIGAVLRRHRVSGPLGDLLIGELTTAVVRVLEPLEFQCDARLFDGISDALPKRRHGPHS